MSGQTIRGRPLPDCTAAVLKQERDECAATIRRLQERLRAIDKEIEKR